jgi:7-keto-8-aminopelargonate synthetase-like enzyme
MATDPTVLFAGDIPPATLAAAARRIHLVDPAQGRMVALRALIAFLCNNPISLIIRYNLPRDAIIACMLPDTAARMQALTAYLDALGVPASAPAQTPSASVLPAALTRPTKLPG